MPIFHSKITIDLLLQVYKNVKVDSFYETGHLTALMYAGYEENLTRNLENLLNKIKSNDIDWFESKEFVGSFRILLKTVKIPPEVDCKKSKIIYSNQNRIANKKAIPDIDFRIIGNHSIDFHVLSSLWIELVGKKLDKKIGNSSYGCRVKGFNDKNENKSKNGNFRSYIYDYQKWQYNGLEKITTALNDNKKVVAIMADIKKYYHRLDCDFLLNDTFQNEIGFGFENEEEEEITRLLIAAIKSWSSIVFNSKQVSDKFKLNGHSGLPMGIGASKVIANLALVYFDKQIENEIKPIYYGRYVDDIFLVLEDGVSIDNEEKIWSFLLKRINGLKKPIKQTKNLTQNNCNPNGYTLNIPYLKNSHIEFGREKQKYFFMEGISGLALLNSIKESIIETSSEWNLPPNPSHDIDSLKTELTSLNNDPSEIISGLGKSNGLSIQRNKFVLYLKRFETIIDLLPETSWNEKIENFIKLTIEYAVNPNTISIFSKYYSKIIGLTVKTGKYQLGIELICKIEECYKELEELVKNDKNKAQRELNVNQLIQSLNFQKELLFEGLYFNLIFKKAPNTDQFKILISKLSNEFTYEVDVFNAIQNARKLFTADLHRIPLKNLFIQPKLLPPIYYMKWGQNANKVQFENFKYNFDFLWIKIFGNEYSSKKIPLGLLYYTRPFSLLELTLIIPNWDKEENNLNLIKLCKFYHIDDFEYECKNSKELNESLNIKTISIASNNSKLDRVIAFTSLETINDSWISSVREDGIEPDKSREERILELVSNILSCKQKNIDYVLFPELSIPRKLLSYISGLFFKKRISLIAGIEYSHSKMPIGNENLGFTGIVSNQLIYILCVQGKTQSHQVGIIQEKTIPAHKEETELFSVGGKLLKAEDSTKYLINHGGFWFSGLICNDLLNIYNRAQLRGLIDALIVVEWNQDISTYDSLVESTSNDLHTFVLQVNNRKYGDTRLRGPYKETHERDKVRVRGGELDYFVVATLEVEKLREFQRNHRSPDKPFKPMPTGFKMSAERKKI